MKAHSSLLLFAVLLVTGCAMQAGTEDSSSSAEELNAQTGTTVQAQGATPTTRVRTNAGVEKQQKARPSPVSGDGIEKGVDLSVGPGVDPGDPVQDPGDGNEPDPHPWHTTTGTVLKK